MYLGWEFHSSLTQTYDLFAVKELYYEPASPGLQTDDIIVSFKYKRDLILQLKIT